MTVKPLDTMKELRRLAQERPVLDYEATRRALAEQERLRLYANWRTVGAGGGNPGFQNGWANWTGGSYEQHADARTQAGFFRDQWGFIHLRGVVENPGTYSLAAIFTLPSQLVPLRNEYFGSGFWGELSGFPGSFIRLPCLLITEPTGIVRVGSYSATDLLSAPRAIALDGWSFEAANRGAV
jgi:hypothetical protein